MTNLLDAPAGGPKRVLDPSERIAEVLFGLIMVLTFTGSLSAAEAGREDVRTMLIGALGCNTAWGVIDGVLYLMGALGQHGRNLRVYRAIRGARDAADARHLISGALPPVIAAVLDRADFDRMHQRLKQLPESPPRPRLSGSDWRGALGVFLLVFISTFPVAIPFVVMDDVIRAMRASNAIAVAMMFIAGVAYGRAVGWSPWAVGFLMVALGCVLVALTIALGVEAVRAAHIAYIAFIIGAVLVASGAHVSAQTAASAPEWTFDSSVYTYFLPDEGNYAQPRIATDRGWLHLEARLNYEDLNTGSMWLGYNVSGGETLEWALTPLLGGVFGQTDGVAPGYAGSLSWRQLEFYSEGEYLFDAHDSADSFFYNWSELTFRPAEWFRAGLVTERTRAYEAQRDIQRGLLVGITYKNLEATTYVFNPDDSNPIVVLAVAFSF